MPRAISEEPNGDGRMSAGSILNNASSGRRLYVPLTIAIMNVGNVISKATLTKTFFGMG